MRVYIYRRIEGRAEYLVDDRPPNTPTVPMWCPNRVAARSYPTATEATKVVDSLKARGFHGRDIFLEIEAKQVEEA